MAQAEWMDPNGGDPGFVVTDGTTNNADGVGRHMPNGRSDGCIQVGVLCVPGSQPRVGISSARGMDTDEWRRTPRRRGLAVLMVMIHISAVRRKGSK
jgi:hypothetical protein